MSNELWIGLVAAVGASVLFGTVFVPVKKVDAGDGFSAQMFMCIGGLLASIFIHFLLGFPSVQGFAMIGGAAWGVGTGNGMALSCLVWNALSCITGWATSRYGLLGLPAAVPASAVLNYLGIFMFVVGGVMYMFVKNNVEESTQEAEKGKVRSSLKLYLKPRFSSVAVATYVVKIIGFAKTWTKRVTPDIPVIADDQ